MYHEFFFWYRISENNIALTISIKQGQNVTANEKQYLDTFLEPIRKCKNYRPKLGQGNRDRGVSLDEFKILYGADPFYSWIGLNAEAV